MTPPALELRPSHTLSATVLRRDRAAGSRPARGVLAALPSLVLAWVLAACGAGASIPEAPLPGAGIVDVQVSLDQSVVEDADGTAIAMVTLEALTPPPGVDASVHVAIVLDTSGSMEGRRMENALQAAHGLVNRLANGDRLTIVGYGDDAKLPIQCHALRNDRRDAHAALDELVAEGNTCISCGLQTAYNALASCPDTTVERVILMSDGHANRGLTDANQLTQVVSWARSTYGIETSTIGLGRLHDETRMAELAAAGAADYYFLRNSDMFVEVLETELADLHETAVVNVRLALRPGDGVSIVSTPNSGSQWAGEQLLFDFGQLAVGETRQVVVELALPAGEPGRALLAEVTFADASGRLYASRDGAAVERTEDPEVARGSLDVGVVKTMMSLRAALALETALVLVESGDQAAARETLEAERLFADDYNSGLALPDGAVNGAAAVALDEVLAMPTVASEEQRGETLRLRAVTNDRRRGRAAPQPIYSQETQAGSALE